MGRGSAPEVSFSPPGSIDSTQFPSEPGLNPYFHIKTFLRYVQPHPLPLELLQDYMKNKVSTMDLIKKVLEMEAGFLTLLLTAVIFSLIVPIMTLNLCAARAAPRRTCAPNCKRRTLVFVLHIILFLLLLGAGGMLWTNEECSRGVSRASESLPKLAEDTSYLWSHTLGQLQHLLTRSFDEVLLPLTSDLNDAENLLGRPIQVELVLETGVDSALDNLMIIAAGAKELCSQVMNLVQHCMETDETINVARIALDDLRRQLETVKNSCGVEDRSLCDTISSSVYIKLNINQIRNSTQLSFLKQVGIENLSSSVIEANNAFTSIPDYVNRQTKAMRQAISTQLNAEKTSLKTAALSFNKAKGRVEIDLGDLKENLALLFEIVQYLDYWRWLTGLVAGISVLYIWSLLTGATCCGCCGGEEKSSPTLIVTVILVSLISLFLWFLMMCTFILGGHAEVYICHTLEEHSRLKSVSKLLDTGGILLESDGSFLSQVLFGNSSISLSIGDFIEQCRKNSSVYNSLNLKHLLDIEETTNTANWTELLDQMQHIKVNLKKILILTPKLHANLNDLLQGLMINISAQRSQISGPVSTDLEAVASHLEGVAAQIKDINTVTHLDTLSKKSRRLLNSYIKDLESHKEHLIYQLTALELKIGPLQRQVNQTLSHLKAVQYYISNHGEATSSQAVNKYIGRLRKYLILYENHVRKNVKDITCKPFWDLYRSMKLLICRYTIDPLNGFWFSTLWCLLIFLIQTPICLKLIEYYSQVVDETEMNTSQSYVNEGIPEWTSEHSNDGW